MSLTQLIDQYNEAKKAMMEDGGKELAQHLKAILFTPANEHIAAFRFTAYSPYFNDGDLCTFSVNDLEFITFSELNERDTEETELLDRVREVIDDEYELPGCTWGLGDDQMALKLSIEEFTKIPADLIESVLGEHISVIVTRDGVTVDEYDHE